MEGDDVHVALDRHHRGAAEGGFAGEVEAVEAAALLEERRFRAVDVFRLAVAEGAAAEADRAAAPVADREDDAVEEVFGQMPAAPFLALLHQTGLDELGRLDSFSFQ